MISLPLIMIGGCDDDDEKKNAKVSISMGETKRLSRRIKDDDKK